MNQGQDRVACPRCRANNFVGIASCWQCGGPMPPPEAIAGLRSLASPPAIIPSGSKGQRGAAGTGISVWPVRIAALVFILLGLLFAGSHYARTRMQTTNVDPAAQAAIEEHERIMREMESRIRNPAPLSNPSALDPDSLEAQARREMERLQKEHGLAPAPTAQDGRVHLRGGGTLSPEEWQRARDSLRGK